MSKENYKFSDAINMALDYSLKKDKNLICYGLGVNDPKRVFGTTQNLVEKYGGERIFDVPNSENTIMGISVGAGLKGIEGGQYVGSGHESECCL